MCFTKEDFDDLSLAEIMQNVWDYSHTIIERGEKTPQFVRDYCRWCEKILFKKWSEHNELPSCEFVLDKLKKQKKLFYPSLLDAFEEYLGFLRGLKKEDENVLNEFN